MPKPNRSPSSAMSSPAPESDKSHKSSKALGLEQPKTSKGISTRRDKRRRVSIEDDADARPPGDELDESPEPLQTAISELRSEIRDLFDSLTSGALAKKQVDIEMEMDIDR